MSLKKTEICEAKATIQATGRVNDKNTGKKEQSNPFSLVFTQPIQV